MKNLKQLVRDIVDPDRNLGHVDRDHKGKKPGSIAVEKSSMSTKQSAIEEAEESKPRYRRIASLTTIPKAPQDGHEQAIPLDTNAAVARSAVPNRDGKEEKRQEKIAGEIEPCEDCK